MSERSILSRLSDAATGARRLWPFGRPAVDPAHAPGHRHRKPPPRDTKPDDPALEPRRNTPWIRTTHSDSQRRRPRR